MAFDNAARILGTFEGAISSKTELHVGEGGSCTRSRSRTSPAFAGTISFCSAAARNALRCR